MNGTPTVDITPKTLLLAIVLSLCIAAGSFCVLQGLFWCCENIWKEDGARVAQPEKYTYVYKYRG